MNGDFILENSDLIVSCNDLSDGGLALAAFKMCESADIGVSLNVEGIPELFGEDQARYLISCNFDQAQTLLNNAAKTNVLAKCIGTFGGTKVCFGNYEADMDRMSNIYRSSFQSAVT